MSFSTTIRDELGELPIKPLCCRRAFLYGLLYGAQTEEDGVTMTFSVYKDAACQPYEQAVHLIRTLFSREAEVTHQTRGAHRYATVSFHFKKAAEHLLAMAEHPEDFRRGFEVQKRLLQSKSIQLKLTGGLRFSER